MNMNRKTTARLKAQIRVVRETIDFLRKAVFWSAAVAIAALFSAVYTLFVNAVSVKNSNFLFVLFLIQIGVAVAFLHLWTKQRRKLKLWRQVEANLENFAKSRNSTAADLFYDQTDAALERLARLEGRS